jgi:hypothetical protein
MVEMLLQPKNIYPGSSTEETLWLSLAIFVEIGN